jgi:hypothetical protein
MGSQTVMSVNVKSGVFWDVTPHSLVDGHQCLGELWYLQVREEVTNKRQQTNKLLWPESASELYQPRDRRLPAELVSTFADRRVSRSERGG